MSRHPEVESVVNALVGSWTGTGVGGYPTLDPFEYRESLIITPRDDHPSLHYEQRTWRKTTEAEVVSHWETGLIRLSSDGSATLHNAQPGRVEVMGGTWESVDGGWSIQLISRGYAGDDRVITSTRSVRLDEQSLSYRHEMETTATHEMSVHLEANLSRSAA